MYYPIMLNLENKNVLVVGGGKVAYRKSLNLLKSGVNLTVVSLDFIEEFYKLEYEIEFIKDKYKKEYLIDKNLVIAATSSKDINLKIKQEADKYNILVNLVDDKDNSDFITPAIVDNDAIQIAISSNGSFPSLSKYIRQDLEYKYSKYDKEYLLLLEKLREIVLLNYFEDRKEIFRYSLSLSKQELINYIDEIDIFK